MRTIKTEIEIRNKKSEIKRMAAYGQKLRKKTAETKKEGK